MVAEVLPIDMECFLAMGTGSSAKPYAAFTPRDLTDAYLDTGWISFDAGAGSALVVLATKDFESETYLRKSLWKTVRRVPLVRAEIRVAGVESLDLDGPPDEGPWMVDVIDWDDPTVLSITAGAITATIRGDSLIPDMFQTDCVIGEAELTSRLDIYESESICELRLPTN